VQRQQLCRESKVCTIPDYRGLPSLSVTVTAVELFPRLMLAPGVIRSKITVKSSSPSIRLSTTAVKDVHSFAPLVDPIGNVRETEDSCEKSLMEVAEKQVYRTEK
jgi:hypothetical protein